MNSYKKQRIVACVMFLMIAPKEHGAKTQIKNEIFCPLHVYFHLGKNPPLSTTSRK